MCGPRGVLTFGPGSSSPRLATSLLYHAFCVQEYRQAPPSLSSWAVGERVHLHLWALWKHCRATRVLWPPKPSRPSVPPGLPNSAALHRGAHGQARRRRGERAAASNELTGSFCKMDLESTGRFPASVGSVSVRRLRLLAGWTGLAVSDGHRSAGVRGAERLAVRFDVWR